VLAAVARTVNDYTSDAARQRLAVLASDLSALAPARPEVGVELARRCLLTALPYAGEDRRHVITVGLLGLDRAAHGMSRDWHHGLLDLDSELALERYEREVEAAAAMVRRHRVAPREYLRRGLPVAIEVAITAIATNAPDADGILAGLLSGCITDVRSAVAATVPSVTCAASSGTSASDRPSR
jgi:hypothetical protein